jgi:hypothetical protein
MGFLLELDTTNKIIRISFTGVVTEQAFLTGYTALRNGNACRGPCHAIVDYTGATNIEVSTELIKEIARKTSSVPMDYLLVNVTPENFAFGLARMFQILSSENRPNLRVVRTMREALKMIGVKTPMFSPIENDLAESA